MRNFLFIFLFLFSASSAVAQFTYSGVFIKAEADHQYAFQLSWEAFLQRHDSLSTEGFRLVDIESAKSGARRYHWGIWRKDDVPSTLMRVESWDSLVIMKRQMAADSFVMDEVEGYTYGGKEYYLVVWIPGNRLHKIRKLASWQGVENDHENMSRMDLQMVDVEVFHADDSTAYYLVLYQWDGPEFRTYYYRSHSLDDFLTDREYRQRSGYRLFDYEQFEKRGKAFYTGLYKGAGSGRLEGPQTWQDFSERMEALKAQDGLVLADLDVYLEKKER